MKSAKNTALKKAGIFIAIIIVIAGSFFVYRFFNRKNAKAASDFITYQVKNGSIQSSVSATGVIAASDSRDITVPGGSVVENVNCTEGQAVKTGDILFTLSNDSAQLDLEKSKLNLSQLENQLNSLNSQLGGLSINAPVSGIVRSVNVGVGDSLGQQGGTQSGAVQIEDTSAMQFTVNPNSAGLGQSLLESMVPGQEIKAQFSGVSGVKDVKVLSLGSGITFQVLNTSGLTWDNYYNVTFIMQDGDAALPGPVRVEGSLVNVNSKQSGTVSEVYVKPGQSVKSGTKLIALNNDSLSNQIQSQEVSIQSAQLDVDSKQSVIDSLTVKAPIDGVVHDIQVKTGDVVGTSSKASVNTPGSVQSGDVIASIENRSSMQVALSVDELDIGKVKAGQNASVTVDAFTGKTFSGKVTSISSDGVAQNGTSTFQVTVNIDDPAGLMAGMTANVSITVASKDNALILPVDAVQDRQGRKFVLFDDNGTITTKEVTLGIVNTDNAEITSGLSEGDTVAVQLQNPSANSSPGNNSKSSFKLSGMSSQGGGQNFMNRITNKNRNTGN